MTAALPTAPRVVIATFSVLCALMASGCQPERSGGLISIAEEAAICVPQDAAGRALVGYDPLLNTSDSSVEPVAVVFPDDATVELLDAGLFPTGGSHFMGATDQYEANAPIEWLMETIEPGESVDLLVGLQAAPEGGEVTGISVEYRESGRLFRVSTSTRIVLAPLGEVCEEVALPGELARGAS